jgi:hypothetical protein
MGHPLCMHIVILTINTEQFSSQKHCLWISTLVTTGEIVDLLHNAFSQLFMGFLFYSWLTCNKSSKYYWPVEPARIM